MSSSSPLLPGGGYSFRGNPGATPGMHRIFISTADESGGSETVPARYNRKTELTATVDARDATIDFPMESPDQN